MTAYPNGERCAAATAERWLAYLLNAYRGISYYSKRLKAERLWKKASDAPCGLLDRSVGIVGLDGVSEQLIRLLLAFGCRVGVCSDTPLDAALAARGVEQSTLDGLADRSEVLWLGRNGASGAVERFGEAQMKALRRGTVLLIAAPEAIDPEALSSALSDGALTVLLRDPTHLLPASIHAHPSVTLLPLDGK